MERYDPLTDTWCFVRSMSTPRAGACAAELNGEILVAGGFGDSTEGSFPILDRVESFNPFTNRYFDMSLSSFLFIYINSTLWTLAELSIYALCNLQVVPQGSAPLWSL